MSYLLPIALFPAPSPTVTLSPSPPPTESPSPLSPQSTIPLPPLPPSTPSPQPPSTSPPPSTPSPQPPSPSPSLLRHPSDVPSNVRTTEVTSSDITILWHPMDFITGYSLWYGVHGSGSSQIVYIQGAATTETTISGLNSTTNYSIKVAAVNNAGIGNYSDPIIATTKGIHSIHCLFCLTKSLKWTSLFAFTFHFCNILYMNTLNSLC